jgi:hypothetical protein
MLRRFEIYSVSADAPDEAVKAMAQAMRDCPAYIPEVLHSAIGYAQSDTSLNFVWEHAYASPETYRRYMAHPYHAAILDRYLLNDSPERIITDNEYGLGLAGYSCETPDYLLPDGAARRLVALRLKDGAESEFAAIAAAEVTRNGMVVSVFKDNSFAARWFDGETLTGLETPFTHLWEQGFASIEAARSYQPQWRDTTGGIVESAVELLYAVEAGWGYPGALES